MFLLPFSFSYPHWIPCSFSLSLCFLFSFRIYPAWYLTSPFPAQILTSNPLSPLTVSILTFSLRSPVLSLLAQTPYFCLPFSILSCPLSFSFSSFFLSPNHSLPSFPLSPLHFASPSLPSSPLLLLFYPLSPPPHTALLPFWNFFWAPSG